MDQEGQVAEASLATAYDGDHYDAHELARLADELVDQIATARRHYAELRSAIDATEVAGAALAVRERHGGHGDDDGPDESQQGYHRTPEEEAEIVALGMALNGGDRQDAHLHIVETFGIYDTDEILDRTFGATEVASDGFAPRRRFGRLRRG
jgi:hypothetical protein